VFFFVYVRAGKNKTGFLRNREDFVRLENGCYLQVVDPGNGVHAIPEKTAVLISCRASDLLTEKYLAPDSEKPVHVVYGSNVDEVMKAYSDKSNSPEYLFLSKGLMSALDFVSENAKVKMIIPFIKLESHQYSVSFTDYSGSIYQTGNHVPLYYDEISFQFENID
jgi:hypothetical protein